MAVSLVFAKQPFYDDKNMRSTLDPDAQRAALALLARGLMRPHEVARLAGVSLQVVNYWIKCAGVDWQRVRERRNADAWQKELNHGAKLVQRQGKKAKPSGATIRH